MQTYGKDAGRVPARVVVPPPVAFTYAFPHKKTQDVIVRLAAMGVPPKAVIAAPRVDLPLPPTTLRVKPRHADLLDPADLCRELGIEYIVAPHDPQSLLHIIDLLEPEIGLVAGARILDSAVIERFRFGIVNLHPGLLPETRGLDALQWAIYNGAPLGATAHVIDERVDAGWILERRQIERFRDDTLVDLGLRLHETQLAMIESSLVRAVSMDRSCLERVGRGPYNRSFPADAVPELLARFDRQQSQLAPSQAAVPPTAPPPPARPIEVSVLVPACNEADNLPRLLPLLDAMIVEQPVGYEVIVIDDGSSDASPAVLGALAASYPCLRIERHRVRRGIADALSTGAAVASGSALVFFPADLQFLPDEIPRLVGPVLRGEADMVTGRKEGHYEKAFVSSVYNGLSRMLFGVQVKDLNSVKAFRREVMLDMPSRPDWHRFLVVIGAANGFSAAEVPVRVYPRHAGRSKFGVGRIPVGIVDLVSVWFELRFGRKPLLLFGMTGAAVLFTGALAGVIAVAVYWVTGIGVRWLWTLIQTSLLLGSLLFVGGLIGEMVAGVRAEIRSLTQRGTPAS